MLSSVTESVFAPESPNDDIGADEIGLLPNIYAKALLRLQYQNPVELR
jgi:hypothetical protein